MIAVHLPSLVYGLVLGALLTGGALAVFILYDTNK